MASSSPEQQDQLIAQAMGQAGESDAQRIRSITELGNLLGNTRGSLTSPKGLMCLIDLVQREEKPRIVTHAIGALGRLQALSAVMILIDAALGLNLRVYEGDAGAAFLQTDEALRLRCAAVQALGKIQDERAVIPLMSILNDRALNYRLRMSAAESLGRAGNPHALNSLMDILQDDRESSVYLRESTAKALGMLGDIRAIDSLLDLLEAKRGVRDKFIFLKEQAIEALGRLSRRSGDKRRVTDSLVRSLRDSAASIRLAAVEALADTDDPRFVPNVGELLRDSDEEVALAAVSAVFRLGGEAAIREWIESDNLPQYVRDEMETYIP